MRTGRIPQSVIICARDTPTRQLTPCLAVMLPIIAAKAKFAPQHSNHINIPINIYVRILRTRAYTLRLDSYWRDYACNWQSVGLYTDIVISSTYTQDVLRQPSEPPPDLFSHNVCKLNAWNDVRLDFVSNLGLLLKGIRQSYECSLCEFWTEEAYSKAVRND